MPSELNQTRPVRVQCSTAAYPPPNLAEPLPCPRCNSIITKFCYYNNYNLLQPHYFCKSCRRYWTQGGTLRDIPIITTANGSEPMNQGTVTNKAKGSNEISGVSLTLGNGTGSDGLNYGFGHGYRLEEMSVGYLGGGSGGEIPVVGGNDTWHIGEMEGKTGDSLWPALEIFMQSNGAK
ncbi:hypothetical protein N665_0691s0010 [Sinapis alba]|nr:hypothetical protein N665_0691s0010 [Sinapis alba]